MRSGGLRCALAALALCALAQAAPVASTVRKVELATAAPDSARLVVDLSAMPQRKVFTLEKSGSKPERVVIDLSATRLAPGLRLPQAAGPVLSVRSGEQPGKTLRLVVEVNRKFEPVVSVSGSTLTIDMGAVQKPDAAAPAPAATPPPPAPVRVAHAPEDSGRDIIVAVDAGHGGDDSGALGARGTMEKTVTLAIARALAKRIDSEPGYRAYLTRSDDRYIELPQRIALASRARADIFVSIHADSFPKNRSVAGSSIYVLSEKGASNAAAQLLAEHENSVDAKHGRGASTNQLASVLMDLQQTRSIGKSMEIAEIVLPHLDRIGTVRKTQVQRAGFAVLKLPDTPSILVETAYISNPDEEQKLQQPEHQRRIAEAIFNGVREFFRSSPPDGTLVARQRAQAGVGPIMAGSARP